MTTESTAIEHVALLVNPTSGLGRGAKLGAAVEDQLAAAGLGSTTSPAPMPPRPRTTPAGRSRPGSQALVVVGGDGMVHLGANVVAGTDVPLGIVAAGTGNDIARALGLPIHDAAAAADVVRRGSARVDRRRPPRARRPGRAAPAGSSASSGAGFDAKVNERANAWRWPKGKMRYNLAIVRELPVFKPLPYVLELDGEQVEANAMLVAVGNGPSYGGGMQVCPDAELDDGLLDVMIVDKISIPEFLKVFPKVYSGAHKDHPAVTIRRAKQVRLDTPGIVSYADGERYAPLPMSCEVVPGALRVLV